MRRVSVVALCLAATSCSGSAQQAGDLVFQLVPVANVVQLDPGDVFSLGSSTGILNEEVLVYSFAADEAELASSSSLEGAVRFLRDPVFLRDFEFLTREASSVVIFLRPVPAASNQDISEEGLIVGLGVDGNIVSSDFEDDPEAAQLEILFAGIDPDDRVNQLTQFISAARARELGEPIDDPQIEALLDAVLAAG